jgi:hypothetical protein
LALLRKQVVSGAKIAGEWSQDQYGAADIWAVPAASILVPGIGFAYPPSLKLRRTSNMARRSLGPQSLGDGGHPTIEDNSP